MTALALGLAGIGSSASAEPILRLNGSLYANDGVGEPIPGVSVRIFKKTGETWTLAAEDLTGDRNHDGKISGDEAWSGGFNVELEPGTYKAVANDVDRGTPAYGMFGSTTWRHDGSEEFVFDADDYYANFGDTGLDVRTALVETPVVNECGMSPGGVVEAYDASGAGTIPAYERSTQAPYGKLTAATLPVPTRFRYTAYRHAPQWIGGTSFATATTFSGDAPTVVQGPATALHRTFVADPAIGDNFRAGVYFNGSQPASLAGIAVRLYRAPTYLGPWTFDRTLTTTESGMVSAYVPGGVYRMTINLKPDDTVDNPLYTATSEIQAGDEGPTDDIVCHYGDRDINGSTTGASGALERTGGTIAGRLLDSRGNAVRYAKVEVFSPDAAPTDSAMTTGLTNARGRYVVEAPGSAVALRFSTGKAVDGTLGSPILPLWSGDASTLATAATFTSSVGQSTDAGVDHPADGPITAITPPSISGITAVGSRLTAKPGVYQQTPVTVKRQWFKIKGGVTSTLSGYTGTTYTPKTSDLGARIEYRETVTPPATHPTVPTKVFTVRSATIKRKVGISLTASTSGRKITAKARVSVKGETYPDGKIIFSWYKLAKSGTGFVRTGSIHTRTISYRDGRAVSTVITVSSGGYWGIEATSPSTSTRLSATKSGYVTIK